MPFVLVSSACAPGSIGPAGDGGSSETDTSEADTTETDTTETDTSETDSTTTDGDEEEPPTDGAPCLVDIDCEDFEICDDGECEAVDVTPVPDCAAPLSLTPLAVDGRVRSTPGRVVFSDVLGDQARELVVGSPEAIDILVAGGEPLVVTESRAPRRDVLAGDLDDDGNADVVVVEAMGVSIYLGDGTGSFVASVAVDGFEVFESEPVAGTLADVDADGALDLVVATPDDLGSWLGDGQGGLELGEDTLSAGSIGLATVSSSPEPDAVAAVGPINLRVWQPESGTSIQVLSPLGMAGWVDAADLTDGGQTDILLLRSAAHWSYLNPYREVGAWLGGARHGLVEPHDNVVVADVDVDGSLDAVVGGPTYAVVHDLARPCVAEFAGAVGSTDLAVADFDGDGLPDIAGFEDDHAVVYAVD